MAHFISASIWPKSTGKLEAGRLGDPPSHESCRQTIVLFPEQQHMILLFMVGEGLVDCKQFDALHEATS